MLLSFCISIFFFFNDTATTEIYTLSLHDALPISRIKARRSLAMGRSSGISCTSRPSDGDRKSTRLNSSHSQISYAVFCLKKKKKKKIKQMIKWKNRSSSKYIVYKIDGVL